MYDIVPIFGAGSGYHGKSPFLRLELFDTAGNYAGSVRATHAHVLCTFDLLRLAPSYLLSRYVYVLCLRASDKGVQGFRPTLVPRIVGSEWPVMCSH